MASYNFPSRLRRPYTAAYVSAQAESRAEGMKKTERDAKNKPKVAVRWAIELSPSATGVASAESYME